MASVEKIPENRSLRVEARETSMRAGIIAQPCRAEIRTITTPAYGAGEILVRVEGCGICGSNLPVWEGRPWFTYPLAPGAPGHEAWGTVDSVGSEVTRFQPGERVALLTEAGFAEYLVAPAANAILIPEALDNTPFPGEPLACVMNIARRSAIKPGESVAIVGIGFLGALLTKLAKLTGARVTAVSRRRFSLDIAEQFGADATVALAEDSANRAIRFNGGNRFDCVIEAAGTQQTLDLATQLTKERGRLVIAGYHQDGTRTVDMQLWNWRGLDVINAHERDSEVYLDGMRAALEAILNGSIDPKPLYTFFSLDELGDAFEMLRLRPTGFMKALVLP